MSASIPGNLSSTTTLATGTPTRGSLDFTGDTDWWRASLRGGYGYQVWVEGASSVNGSLQDPYLRIFNAAGTQLVAVDDGIGMGRDAYTYFTPATSGTYFLSAESYGNVGTGTYRITLVEDVLDSTASQAQVNVDARVTGVIAARDDSADWFRVTLTAGVQYQIDLTGSEGDGGSSTLADPWVGIRNQAGTLLASNDDAGLGANARLFFTPTLSGTYFIDAQSYAQDESGSYALTINSAPSVGTLTIGQPRAGSLSFAGEVCLYSVTLTAGTGYLFGVVGDTLADPFLEVLDASGSTIAWDNDSGSATNASLTFTPSTTGTYFLAVRESGNNAIGRFSLTSSRVPKLSVDNAYAWEGKANTGGTLTFTFTLSEPASVPVTVQLATAPGSTATGGVDYLARTGTLNMPVGVTQATWSVSILGDQQFEPTEAVRLVMSNATGAALEDSEVKGFVMDDDEPVPLPTDAYARLQWYLYPDTGANVIGAWSAATGAGVRVGVFDQGIDPAHPDLDGNLATALGRVAGGLVAGGAPIESGDNHGTAVAGVIAAERDGQGVVGVAYEADLVSIYSSLAGTETQLATQITNAFRYAAGLDILNDSWGFAPQYYSNSPWAFLDNFRLPTFAPAGAALKSLADSGRGGLGTIVVQSAGNSFEFGDDTNLHNFQNSRYIITVAATGYDGDVTSYSSPGASVLIAAPGGGGGDIFSEIITTDRTGTAGYASGTITAITGTSFSSPVVAGIVALMLQANPKLGWRDVQEILALSARVTASDDHDWAYNGASHWNGGGLHFDDVLHNLGFGLVDARAAVRLAESWAGAPRTSANAVEISKTVRSPQAIPDGTSLVSQSTEITDRIDIERVEVTIEISHTHIGDLAILLTSPAGTSSWLMWRPGQSALSAFGQAQDNINFTFTSVLSLGESSVGTWSLAVFDMASSDTGRLNAWTLNLVGSSDTADETYFYTDEFAEAVAVSAARARLTDSAGLDTLNAATVTTASRIDLRSGATSTIDGQSLTLGSATLIENAMGGDGDDRMTGNDAANRLLGGRGDDVMDGGAGTDTASFLGAAGSYAVRRSTQGVSVSDRVEGRDGSDQLLAIERLQFDDMTLNLAVKDIAATMSAPLVQRITELYVAFFNRVPDGDGLAYWLGQARAGVSLDAIANAFYDAGVLFSAQTGWPATMTHADFINTVYRNVLGRADGADAEGLSYWLQALTSGQETRGTLVSAILDVAHSSSFTNHSTFGWVQRLLDHKLDLALRVGVEWGINYNDSTESIARGMAIAGAVTPEGIAQAVELVGVSFLA